MDFRCAVRSEGGERCAVRRGEFRRCFAVALILGALPHCGDAVGAGEPCGDARLLLAGVKAERAKLRKGVYKATGRAVLFGGTAGPVVGDVAIFSAFDFDERVYRVDRSAPQGIVNPVSGEREIRDVATKFIRTPYVSKYWDNAYGAITYGFVSIYPPEWSPPKEGRLIDVRTFGTCGWDSVVDCPAFESAIDALQAYRVVDVKVGAAGECVVTLLHGPNDDIKTSLWVDVARGFTIRREEVRARNLSTGEWTGIVALTETAWEEWSGVWVPTSFLLERHFNGDETYSLSLDWSSVNEQIEDVVFETEGLGVERGTPILDERLGGKPVVLGRVGGEIKAIEELPAVDRSGLNQWRIVLMNCGLVVLLALVVVVGRRVRNRIRSRRS